MLKLTESNFNSEIENSSTLVVIDLYADWCGPCKMLAPHFSALESELAEIKFCKINVDEEPKLAELFHVSSIPMIAYVKNNVFLDFSVGYMEKEELRKKILEMNCSENQV